MKFCCVLSYGNLLFTTIRLVPQFIDKKDTNAASFDCLMEVLAELQLSAKQRIVNNKVTYFIISMLISKD